MSFSRCRWACLCVIGCALLVSGIPSQAEARRSLRKIHNTWETLLGNQTVQSYYCVGLLGDLYRSKIYKPAKVARYSQWLFKRLGQQKLFLMKLVKKGSSSQRRLYRHMLATTDLLLISVRSLQQISSGKAARSISAFLKFRNAAAKSVGTMLRHPSLKRRRYYSGGWRKGIAYLSHYINAGAALGYLATGLIADAYFHQMLSKTQAKGYIVPSLRLIKGDQDQLKQITQMVHPADRSTLRNNVQAYDSVYQAGAALGQYINTRRRSFLAQYATKRKLAWTQMQSLGQ